MVYTIRSIGSLEKWAGKPTFLLGVVASMKDDTVIAEKVRQIVEPIIQSEGLELVDLEYRREHRGRVLRLFIDREGGVTVDDCASISHEVDKNLEIEGIPPGPYTLEVSSPGLKRPLKREADFYRFTNRLVKVRTAELIEDKRTFRGKLLACHDGLVEIEENSRVVQVPLDQIVKANLEYEF
jgi:ribosome maturation factor RimP